MSSWATCSRWSCLGRGIELNDLQSSLSTLVIMWFCIFVIHCFYHHWIFANSALLSNQQNLLRVWKIKNFLLWYSLSRICMKITMSVWVQWGVISGCKLYPLALFCWKPHRGRCALCQQIDASLRTILLLKIWFQHFFASTIVVPVLDMILYTSIHARDEIFHETASNIFCRPMELQYWVIRVTH